MRTKKIVTRGSGLSKDVEKKAEASAKLIKSICSGAVTMGVLAGIVPTIQRENIDCCYFLAKDLEKSKGLHPLFTEKRKTGAIILFLEKVVISALKIYPHVKNPAKQHLKVIENLNRQTKKLLSAIPQDEALRLELGKSIDSQSDDYFKVPMEYLKVIEVKTQLFLKTRLPKGQKRVAKKGFGSSILKDINLHIKNEFPSLKKRQALTLRIANTPTIAHLCGYAPDSLKPGDFDTYCTRERL